MKRKGIKFKRAKHLLWRHANPEIDKTITGEPLPKNYVAIIRRKDVADKDGNWTERALTAPCVPNAGHSRTNMLYGTWRKQRRGVRVWLDSVMLQEGDRIEAIESETPNGEPCERFLVYREQYWTCSVYWVEDGLVYQGNIRSYNER